MTRLRASASRGFVGYWCLLLAIALVATAGLGTGAAVVRPALENPAVAQAIVPADGPASVGLSGAYQAIDAGQGLRATFNATKVRVTPLAEPDGWTVETELRSYGTAEELTPLRVTVANALADRVSYSFDGITVSMSSTGRGLEQWFTLLEPQSAEARKGPRVVRLSVLSSGLSGTLSKDGRALLFLTPEGHPALVDSILHATDVNGTTVPAHLETSAGEGGSFGLDIVVEGAEAVYPIDLGLRLASRADRDTEPAASVQAPVLSLEEGNAQGGDDRTTVSPMLIPPNDTCGGALVIPDGPYPVLSPITTGVDTATSAGDPTNGCTPAPTENGVWYRFTPAASGVYTLQTCTPPTASNDGDGVLAIFTAASCAGPFTQVVGGCNDDACHSLGPSIISTISLTGGTTYYILASHYPTASGGGPLMTQYQIQISLASPPPNDQCAGAIPLTLNIPKQGSTILAVNDYTLSGVGCYSLPTPPAPVGQGALSTAPGRDVVYSFTAPAAGSYSFRVSKVTAGDPVLYVVSSCPPPSAIPTPPCLGAANRRLTTAPVAEEVTCLPLGAGATVFAYVDEAVLSASGGNFTIEVNPCRREVEANDTPASANPLAGTCGIEGSANPTGGNPDFFALGAVAPDSRIFSMVDNLQNNTGDYSMRITTPTDTYEFDDDDGDVLFGQSGFEPVIAGTKLTPGGPAFIRLNPFSTTLVSEPYRLYQVVQPPSASAVPETEPNGAGDPPNSAGPNYFSGVTSTVDQDDFGFTATAGDLIFVAVDTDPDMNGVATDLIVALFDPSLTNVAQVNGSAAVSSPRTPVAGLVGTTPVAPAEGLVYRAPVSGTYIAAVLANAAGPGNYLMSISKNCTTGGGGIVTTYTFPDTGKIVLELFPPFFPGDGPEIIRLRQNGPDAAVTAQPQVGNTVQTELVAMNLTGVCPGVGTVNVKESPTRPSNGQHLVNNPTSFDSFFDVFVNIDLPDSGGVVLFNDQPFHVVGHHTTLPPHNTAFETQTVPNPDIFLYDVSDPPPGGAPRGRIRYVEHDADPEFPPPDEDCFDTTMNAFFQTLAPFPPYNATLLAHGRTEVVRGTPTPPFPQQIQIEMVQLSLTGNDAFLGPYQIQLNQDPFYPHSLGQVLGQPTRAFPADGFFDVFFEVDSQAVGGRLVTRPGPTDAAHVEATSAGGNPIGTLPCGSGQTFKQPQNQFTRLFRPSDLATPVAQVSNIIHGIDKPKSWEPPPPADKDCFQSRVTARITLFPPFFPGGCTETLVLNGPFKVLRGNPLDPGDGRDLIRTIMACYRFVGTSIGCGLGPVLAHPSTANPSFGQIQSLAAEENTPADSFFDIFTQLETGAGPLHTNDPTHMSATINSVPPGSGEIYLGPGTTIPLYNSANVQVGVIIIISHEIFNSIICPCECEPYFTIRPNKTTLDVGIPLGGAGVDYDVMKGLINGNSPNWLGSFLAANCLSPDGPPSGSDGSSPAASQLFWYVSKDAAFNQYYGTYNACPIVFQVGNRDTEIVGAGACP